MAIRITEDGVVNYENSPDVNRKLFPNLNICGKEIGELAKEIDGKAPAIFSTASGSTASFDNGADDMPLKSCVVSFDPIQEGEGDPSPENVRPISGRTGLSVTRTGINVWDEEWEVGDLSNSGQPITASDRIRSKNFIHVIPNTAYYLKTGVSGQTSWQLFGCYYDVDKNFISTFYKRNSSLTMPSNCHYIKWATTGGYGITYNHDISINYPATDTEYHAYQGQTYDITFPTEAGTVYGGYVDVVSGKLTVDSGYIASYNGETLPSTWISDMDVYAEGLTPTIGAQVAYELAEPIEYQLEPQEITTLFGINNIWSDAGNVSVEFSADTKTYIDSFSIKTVEITGQTPTITAEENTRYICGEVTSLSFTPCKKGICDVRFTAASISTVLTLPETVKLPDWFDPTLLEAGTTYEINVLDGIYGVVMSWA